MKKRRAFLSCIFSLALLCSFILPTFAASYQDGDTTKVTVSEVWAFHGGMQPGETSSTSNGGNRGNHYNNRLYWYEGYSIDILQMDGNQYTPQYNGKTYFYCIHKWTNYGTVNRKFYVDSTGQGNLMNSPYWKNNLNQTQRDLLMLISMYGFPARTPQQLGVSTVDDAYAATQALIWEVVTGRRNKGGLVSGYKSTSEEVAGGIPAAKDNARYFLDKYMHYAYTGNGHTVGEATPALTAYNKIVSDMAKHDTLASFAGQTLTLKWDGASKTYKGSLTDSNGMLANSSITFFLPSGLSAKISGNTILFTTTKPMSTNTVTLRKNLSELWKISPLAVLEATNGEGQEMLCGQMYDPKTYSFRVRTAQGTVKIIKESEDGVVSGLQFRIAGSGFDKTYTTDSTGTITAELPAGIPLTVSEVSPADRYNPPKSQTVTIPDGGTATVTFTNTLKKGHVELYKTDAVTGGSLAGAVFGLYDNQGNRIGEIITDENGYGKASVSYGKGWYLLEEKAPAGCVLDPTKHFFDMTEDGAVITIRATNASQRGQIVIRKVDAETGKPITDTPATFEVRAADDIRLPDGSIWLNAGKLADTVVTEDGSGTSKPLYLGEYVATEQECEGYTADKTPYYVTLEYAGQTVEIATASLTVPNAPQKGQLTITKTDKETGQPILHSPATFEIYARTDIITGDGTVRYKSGELVDTIQTIDGKATSKPLYLGDYYGVETSCEGYVVNAEPFYFSFVYGGQEIAIMEESLTIENTPQKGQLTITKVDAETDKPIIQSSATFEIYAATDIVTPDGTVRYVKDQLIATINTENGIAKTPLLYLGSYYGVETACEGYVVDSEPFYFTFTYGEQEIEVVEQSLTIENQPQMGQITITKVDAETGKPIILSPATFEIYATADVVTPDGTVRYTKGQLVDTIQTVAGVATSKPLYIGKKAEFAVIETIAPEGYYLGSGDTSHVATLTYDRRFAVLKKMSTGAMVDVDSGVELPEGTVPETDNNASLTIPNQRIPVAPKTGVAMPAAAVTLLCGSALGLIGCCIFGYKNRKRMGNDGG